MRWYAGTRLLILSLVAGLATQAHAQARALALGDRVRVTTTAPVEGKLVVTGLDAASLTVASKGAAQVIPWSDVTRFEVLRRRTRRQGAVHGLKWGLAIGSAVGVISLLTPTPEGEEIDEKTLALEAVVDGAVVGAFFGAVFPARRWRELKVSEGQAAGAIAASTPAAAPGPLSPHAGKTPAVELTLGTTSIALPGSQFPGVALSLAVNRALSPTRGFALVGESDVAFLRSAILGGPRFWMRTRPLFSGRMSSTWFAHVLGGTVRGAESGVMRSVGGSAIQPGFGVDIGSRAVAARIQWDHSSVPGSSIDDSRVPGEHVGTLSLGRVIVGVTLRSVPW